MLPARVVHAELESANAVADQPSRAHLERLQAAIAEAVADARDAMEVTVVDGCGEFEVRVGGPSGVLRLSFDRAAHLAFVRSVVRRTVDRYRVGGTTTRKAGARVRRN